MKKPLIAFFWLIAAIGTVAAARKYYLTNDSTALFIALVVFLLISVSAWMTIRRPIIDR